MKVLILARSSAVGGGTTQAGILARGLNARGHDCRIAFTRSGNRHTVAHREHGAIVLEALSYAYAHHDYPHEMSDAINAFQPDWVLIDNREKIEEVYNINERFRDGRTRFAFVCHTEGTPRTMLRSITPYISRVICVSHRSAEPLSEFDPVVIHNGIETVPSSGQDVRALLDIPKDAFVIGYVGRHDDNKATDLLYQAADTTDWWVIMAGPNAPAGPDGQPNIRRFDAPVQNVGDWYQAMNVFVLPSKTEGFALSPMEALHCGASVAMTPTSDYPVVFRDAVSFFDHGDIDGMRRAIIQSPYPVIGQQIISSSLTSEHMVDKYEEALPT